MQHAFLPLLLFSVFAQKGFAVVGIPNHQNPPIHEGINNGKDDRRDLYEEDHPDIQREARKVAALFLTSHLEFGEKEVTLPEETYGEQKDLIRGNRFHTQSAGGACSGFLVAPKIVATAAHCLLHPADHRRAARWTKKESADNMCGELSVVFDYAVTERGRDPKKIPRSKVYGCDRVIDMAHFAVRNKDESLSFFDWALIELKAPVEDRQPVEILRRDDLVKGEATLIITHPSGLPVKIADNAVIQELRPVNFGANLDCNGGCSGGPVFVWRKNPETNETRLVVAGILARGPEREFNTAASLLDETKLKRIPFANFINNKKIELDLPADKPAPFLQVKILLIAESLSKELHGPGKYEGPTYPKKRPKPSKKVEKEAPKEKANASPSLERLKSGFPIRWPLIR